MSLNTKGMKEDKILTPIKQKMRIGESEDKM